MVLSSTSVAFAYTQTYSKYDDKTYTHNTRFDALPKVIGIDVSEHNKLSTLIRLRLTVLILFM